MPPKKPKRDKGTGELALAAGAAAAASLAGTPSAGLAVGWAAAAVAPIVWSRLSDWYDAFKGRRHDKVFRTLVGPDGNEQAARLLAKLESEGWAQEAVFATLREVNEAVSEEAVTILAVLLRDYLGADRPIDWFFRGAQGLFGGLTTEDLKQVKDLLRYLSSSSGPENCTLHASIPRPPNSVTMTDDAPKLTAIVGNVGNPPPPFREAEPPTLPDALRLFSLFKSQQLAFDSGRLPSSHGMVIPLQTARRLQRLIMLAEAAPP